MKRTPQKVVKVIAERTLHFLEAPDQVVLVQLASPRLTTSGDYECSYTVVSPGRTLDRFSVGIDAFQALQLAFVLIGAELVAIERQSGRALRFKDGDIGFPRP